MKRLSIASVSKTIRDRLVLRDCHLEVDEGEICAVVGPNGAGKTTLFKTVAGLAWASTGTVKIDGVTVGPATLTKTLPMVGATIEVPAFFPGQTAREVLVSHVEGMRLPGSPSAVSESLASVGLAEHAEIPVESFSLGMKQRLAIARAFMHQPQIVVLDEPANGLDPDGMQLLKDKLRNFAQRGGAVLMASHGLADLEAVADSVAVLSQGHLSTKSQVAKVLENGSLQDHYNSILGR